MVGHLRALTEQDTEKADQAAAGRADNQPSTATTTAQHALPLSLDMPQSAAAPPLLSTQELAQAKAGDSTALHRILEQVFGHKGFKNRQVEVIQRVISGASTLAILPTGGASLKQRL